MYHGNDEEEHIDGLEQDSSNSNALAMELLQSCPKSWYIRVGTHYLTVMGEAKDFFLYTTVLKTAMKKIDI